jgi:hypothetical protein
MISLCSTRTDLGALCPALLQSLQPNEAQVVGSPVVNVTVWGDQLEYLDSAIAFELYQRSSRYNGNFGVA